MKKDNFIFRNAYDWSIYRDYYHNYSKKLKGYNKMVFSYFLSYRVNDAAYWSDTIFGYNVKSCDELHNFVISHHWNEILDLAFYRLFRCLALCDDWKESFYKTYNINDYKSFTVIPHKCLGLALMKWFEENISLLKMEDNDNMIITPGLFAVVNNSKKSLIKPSIGFNLVEDENRTGIGIGGLVMSSAKEDFHRDEIKALTDKLNNDLNTYKDTAKWFNYDLDKLTINDVNNIIEKEIKIN